MAICLAAELNCYPVNTFFMDSLQRSLKYLGIIVAYVLGSSSLFLFVAFLFVGSFHFFSLSLSLTSALCWNAVLSFTFFLQHSGMVRSSLRNYVKRFVPELYYGLIYTVISGVVLILCLVLWQRINEPIVEIQGVLSWSLRVIFFLSMIGFVWASRALGSFDTFGARPVIAQLRHTEIKDPEFTIKGPYRWVRHPFYFFALVLFWSCPVVTPDRLLFNVLWTAWVVLGTYFEERDLVTKFGDCYVRYQQQVPMLLPWRAPA